MLNGVNRVNAVNDVHAYACLRVAAVAGHRASSFVSPRRRSLTLADAPPTRLRVHSQDAVFVFALHQARDALRAKTVRLHVAQTRACTCVRVCSTLLESGAPPPSLLPPPSLCADRRRPTCLQATTTVRPPSRTLAASALCRLQLLDSSAVSVLRARCTGKMFELTDSIGNKLFDTISISLVCGVHCHFRRADGALLFVPRRQMRACAASAEACMKTEHPERRATPLRRLRVHARDACCVLRVVWGNSPNTMKIQHPVYRCTHKLADMPRCASQQMLSSCSSVVCACAHHKRDAIALECTPQVAL